MQQERFSGRDIAAAATVIAIWSLNFVAMKLALRDFTPLQAAAARFLFSVFPFVLWVKPPTIPVRSLLLYALLQGVGQFGLLFAALATGMTAALSPVVMQVQVFATALLGAMIFRERLGRAFAGGLLVAALGLACFAVNAVAGSGSQAVTTIGLALNVAAACMWAGSNLLVRQLQLRAIRYDALSLIVWSSVVSAAAFTLASLAVDSDASRAAWTQASATGWASVAFIGWGGNVLAYWLWTKLLQRHAASRVAPLSLAVPAIGMVAGIGLLGEQVSPLQWAGAALVMSALLFVFWSRPKRA